MRLEKVSSYGQRSRALPEAEEVMKRHLVVVAALVIAGPAGAAPAPSALALPVTDTISMLAELPVQPVSCATTAIGFAPQSAITTLESIRYQPRSYPPPATSPPPQHSDQSYDDRGGPVGQIHMGFFQPSYYSTTGLVLGFRGGAAIDPHFQLGVNVDWHYRTDEQVNVVSMQALPLGGNAQVQQVLSHASSNLVPMLGYVQLSAGRLPIIPYVGAGAGYEALWLSANDYVTGSHFSAYYGGFGWEGWAGLKIPLGRTRLVGEAFFNEASLSRNVSGGPNYREVVNLEGVGGRFGLGWGF